MGEDVRQAILREERRSAYARVDEHSPGLYACVVCAENVPRFGTTCERCKRNLEEDKLERESNR